MSRFSIGVTGVAVAVLLAGCAMGDARTESAAGDLEVDSLSATRTVLLRVQNDYPDRVRVYTLLGGRANEVASVAPNDVRTIVLDPTLFPYPRISFEVRPEDASMTQRLGPFMLYKGETAELVVAPDLHLAHVEIHHST